MLKMSAMRFNARLDTSHHGPPHPFEVAGVSTEDSHPASVEAMQWVLLYLSIGHGNISHSTAKMCRSIIMHVPAAPVDNEEAFHQRNVDACQTIRNYPSVFGRIRRSKMRRVEACIESHGGHFEHVL
jgi:hypothetical protein